jgi:hypothetical protein
MSNFAVAANEIGAHEKTLVAAAVDTVTFATFRSQVEVVTDGAASLYFTVDGSTPVAGAANTHYLPATASSKIVKCPAQHPSPGVKASGTIVKLISAGTPKYSVSRVA